MEWPWISRKYAELLNRELEFYRARYEAEKERADRAVDALVEWSGREPVSAPVRAQRVDERDAAKEMLQQAQEVFADVGESILGDVNEPDEVEEVPVAPPSVSDRLAAITRRLTETASRAQSAS